MKKRTERIDYKEGELNVLVGNVETLPATKQYMEQLLPTVAKSQITPDSVEGKFATLSYEGEGIWDVWVRHSDHQIGEVLSSRKLSAILKAIDLPVFKLTGEAIIEMTTPEVLQYASVLGLRARRKDATTAALPSDRD